ncbi:hypothetical protein quinque_007007 [Culex quinquefasciatus]
MSGGHEDGDETDTSDEEDSEPEMDRNGRPKPMWPHVVSRAMATSFCALGLFNISRFAIFSIHFGANFIVQFLIFSFLFGIPMLWLQMVLGARIRGGPVTMWRISPICKGIGIALILTQGIIALYSAILAQLGSGDLRNSTEVRQTNRSCLSDTVADYFNGVVLQRYQLGPGGRGVTGIGAVRFQLAFNLAIIWTFLEGTYYFPGSYENIGTDIFLLPSDQPLPPQHATMPTKWLIRYSMVLGESFKRPYANPHQESGYQALRLITELLPSTLAAATQERIGPIWSLIGFLTLLLFGLGQLCAMWKPIAGAIEDSPSSIVLELRHRAVYGHSVGHREWHYDYSLPGDGARWGVVDSAALDWPHFGDIPRTRATLHQ